MEELGNEIARDAIDAARDLAGVVRVSTVEGFGSFYSHAAIWPGEGGNIYLVSGADDEHVCFHGQARAVLASYRLEHVRGAWTIEQE